ncbi:MAG: TIGR00375 family protein [Armatimonadota bacterium]|nr:MAG: TIGR00375 family protein [Armatimonadota bacterium]
MRTVFADLHIHIGRTFGGEMPRAPEDVGTGEPAKGGQPVKITAARDLTFANIARECAHRKGIQMAGVVDCASPAVQREIQALIASGEMIELAGGGLRFGDKTTVILACELETAEADGSCAHHISYFPSLAELRDFSRIMGALVTNLDLSSQRCRLPAQQLWEITHSCGGVFIPAHAFTPHKSIYGNCARRLSDVFDDDALTAIPALELGLSADSFMADRLAELADKTLLSNSDAHSLPKIAREYNALEIEEPTYEEFLRALRREDGRKVTANFGLDPRLGKYHRTFCPKCERIETQPPPVLACPACGAEGVVRGVLDRVSDIADYPGPRPPAHRPPYRYQVPLQFLPKLGPVALGKLLNRFGTEMAVLHHVEASELTQVVGGKLAHLIIAARDGALPLKAGGGGHYGRPLEKPAEAQLDLTIT